ncbi:hypothetical protein BKA81DRAFT_130558 [Phyllosticta paracitricarpa]
MAPVGIANDVRIDAYVPYTTCTAWIYIYRHRSKAERQQLRSSPSTIPFPVSQSRPSKRSTATQPTQPSQPAERGSRSVLHCRYVATVGG